MITSLRNDSSFTIPSPLQPAESIPSDSLITYAIAPDTGSLKLIDAAAAGKSYPRQVSSNAARDKIAVGRADEWIGRNIREAHRNREDRKVLSREGRSGRK